MRGGATPTAGCILGEGRPWYLAGVTNLGGRSRLLDGAPTVFLSCSERYKLTVAAPIRDALSTFGVRAIIVSDEALPVDAQNNPDAKVDSYLNRSDTFVALCTPDDVLLDGTVQCRQNIIDELQRASNRPHLKSRIQVFKAREVKLPSNINPVYDQLRLDDLNSIVTSILRQLGTWGVTKPQIWTGQAGGRGSLTPSVRQSYAVTYGIGFNVPFEVRRSIGR